MNYEKSAEVLSADLILNDIIFEKYLAGILPETRQLSIEELNKDTKYNYHKLRKYLKSNIYKVRRNTVDIKADDRLLSEQSEKACRQAVLKLVNSSKYDEDSFENRIGKFFKEIEFTAEENEFIDLMFNELMAVASIKEFPCRISAEDLFAFNLVNHSFFYRSAKKVYNDILQKKLHAGDIIMSYFDDNLTAFEVADRLDRAEKFDFFFDRVGILKCDLDTDRNVLIKNFLNAVVYSFRDPCARLTLLFKLNSKYPVLKSEKIFNEFD